MLAYDLIDKTGSEQAKRGKSPFYITNLSSSFINNAHNKRLFCSSLVENYLLGRIGKLEQGLEVGLCFLLLCVRVMTYGRITHMVHSLWGLKLLSWSFKKQL